VILLAARKRTQDKFACRHRQNFPTLFFTTFFRPEVGYYPGMNPFTKPIILATCLICALPLLARQTLPLDNWRFQLNAAADACAAKNFDDAAWENIKLPHTWNAIDGGTGDTNYFRGAGWYRTHITLPASAKGKRVLLEFDGAALATGVFVNSQPLGGHVGGYARFRFDVTDAVNFSGDNVLAVRVDNQQTDFLNRNGDFTVFGGLYRPARILLTAPAHIATLDHASPGVFLTAKNVSTNGADVAARIEFANDAANKFSGTVRVTVNSPDGAKISSAAAKIKISANGAAETNLDFHIPRPRLWDGVAAPFVYQAMVELVDAGGRVVDSVVQPLGLRSFEVRPEAGFFLNGRHVALHGVNRHQDWPNKGWAIGTNEMLADFRILQELGANTVRLCHYQHDEFFSDLCDRGGLAVWAELAFVNDPPFTQAGRDNAKEQLRELIRQHYNHPSIFFWSLGNETWETMTNGAADRLLTELAAVVHSEDPSRLSTYASHHELDDVRNFRADVLGFNKYFGWYDGEFSQMGVFLDQFHAANPQVPVGMGEYGAGASVFQHEEMASARRPKTAGAWHPEEYQAKYHEEYWRQLKARPWLWGNYIWCLFDFASPTRMEGDTVGRNDKGLVTADRQTRKDAFYFYQANWTTNPMVHITSKRFSDRTEAKTEVKIYSNADAVELKLNGVSLGRKTSGDRRFVWPAVKLESGVNRIEAVAFSAGQPVATDSCAWNCRPRSTDQAVSSE
jgi:beta-galactosidase